MKRFLIVFSLFFVLFALSTEASAQWQNGNLAVRTNGNSFQSGDALKIEIIALDSILEPFYTQVSYTYSVEVEKKDDDGNVVKKTEVRSIDRKAGPVIESMEKLQSVVLDDTFHFGEGTPHGVITAIVSIYARGSKTKLSTVKSEAIYEEDSKKTAKLYLHSLKRINAESWLTFDGVFIEGGRYTALILSGNKIITQIEVGVYPSGRNELNISSAQLAGTAGKTVDIMIHDHDHGYSSTLARVAIASTP
jgi:hypothetical protein